MADPGAPGAPITNPFTDGAPPVPEQPDFDDDAESPPLFVTPLLEASDMSPASEVVQNPFEDGDQGADVSDAQPLGNGGNFQLPELPPFQPLDDQVLPLFGIVPGDQGNPQAPGDPGGQAPPGPVSQGISDAASILRQVNLSRVQGSEYAQQQTSSAAIRQREWLRVRPLYLQAATTQLTKSFANSRLWEMERVLGAGTYGVTVLLRDKNPFLPRSRRRRVVLKRLLVPDDPTTQEAFDIEARILRNLRGHAHINEYLDSIDDTGFFQSRAGRIAGFLRRAFATVENPPQNIFKPLGRGPALILGFVENGSLDKFLDRAFEGNVRLPNRVLWSWFYCMIRACIAMTHRKPNGPREIEILPGDDDDLDYPLVHHDTYPRNIMIGVPEPRVREHANVPKLTLIDFGVADFVEEREGAELLPEYEAMSENIRAVSLLMTVMIHGDIRNAYSGSAIWEGRDTLAGKILPRNGVDPYPWLDPELRDLIARSYHPNPVQRPSLGNLQEAVERGMAKGEADYPGDDYETDAAIRTFMQQMLNDA